MKPKPRSEMTFLTVLLVPWEPHSLLELTCTTHGRSEKEPSTKRNRREHPGPTGYDGHGARTPYSGCRRDCSISSAARRVSRSSSGASRLRRSSEPSDSVLRSLLPVIGSDGAVSRAARSAFRQRFPTARTRRPRWLRALSLPMLLTVLGSDRFRSAVVWGQGSAHEYRRLVTSSTLRMSARPPSSRSCICWACSRSPPGIWSSAWTAARARRYAWIASFAARVICFVVSRSIRSRSSGLGSARIARSSDSLRSTMEVVARCTTRTSAPRRPRRVYDAVTSVLATGRLRGRFGPRANERSFSRRLSDVVSPTIGERSDDRARWDAPGRSLRSIARAGRLSPLEGVGLGGHETRGEGVEVAVR